jgi:hypothetical protein
MQGALHAPAKSKWRIWHTLGIFVFIAAIMFIVFMIPFPLRLWSWVGTLTLLVVITLVTSHGITGYWRGALIDQRNRLSLSRLQTTLWTLVIFSAFLSATLFNVRGGEPDPLLLSIPIGLWILMGISATSLVGTPLIHNVKQNKDANEEQTNKVLAQLANQQVDVVNLSTDGVLLVNKSPDNAKWSDLFRGEEVGNASQIDLGKIQLFYFTIILVLVYALTLGYLFASQAKIINSLPDFNEGTLALLGISHAAYLTNKAMPQSAS